MNIVVKEIDGTAIVGERDKVERIVKLLTWIYHADDKPKRGRPPKPGKGRMKTKKRAYVKRSDFWKQKEAA